MSFFPNTHPSQSNSGMSDPSAASILKAITTKCRYMDLNLWLIKAHTPHPLKTVIFPSENSTEELLCFNIKIAFVSDAWEHEYSKLNPAFKASFLPHYERKPKSRGRHIRAYLSMKTKALDFFSMVMATLGLLHHWVLLPLDKGQAGHVIASSEGVSQTNLYTTPMSLSELARSLTPAEAQTFRTLALEFVITTEEGYNPDTSCLPRWSQAAAMCPQPRTNFPRKQWDNAGQLCVITEEEGAQGAHLIAHSYHDMWSPILAALDVALAGTPEHLGGHFEALKWGMESLKSFHPDGLEASEMSNENDVIPLSRTCHGFFDAHDLLFNPFGMTWLWTSQKAMPKAVLLSLDPLHPVEGTSLPQEKPFGRLYSYREDEDKNHFLPPMLIAACKVMFHAWGTAELAQAFAAGAGQALATRKNPKRGTESSSSHGPPSAGDKRLKSSHTTMPDRNKVADVASSDREDGNAIMFTEGAAKDEQESSSAAATAPAGSSEHSLLSCADSSGSGSGSHSLDTSVDTSAHSSSSVAKSASSGKVTFSVGAPLRREDLAKNQFEDWWVSKEGGRVGTCKERSAFLRLKKLAFAQVPVEEEERIGNTGSEGSFKRAEALHQHMLITPEEYTRLDCNYCQHGKDLDIIGGEEKYNELLADRSVASFYLFLPVLLTRGAGL